MWNLKSIGATDFMSYKEVALDVKNNETTLIYGKNLTDRGVGSNGSGKSSLLEILCFSLTGNTLRKVKNKELVRNGEELATMTVELENPIINMTLRIERTIHEKKPSTVRLYENGVLREDLQDLKPSETDKVILAHLEIGYNDIINYYLISKEKYSSLLLSSDTQKKEVINRFSKADYIDAVFPEIKKDIVTQQNKVDTIGKAKDSCVTKIELLEEQIDELKKSDYEVEKVVRIQQLEGVVKTKQGEVETLRKAVYGIKDKLEAAEDKKKGLEKEKGELRTMEDYNICIDDLKIELKDKKDVFELNEINPIHNNIAEIDGVINDAKEKISELEGEKKESDAKIAKLEKIIIGEIECPKCSHTFLIGENELTLEEAKEQLELEKQIQEIAVEGIKEQEQVITESRELQDEFKKEVEKKTAEQGEIVQDLAKKIEDIEAERKETSEKSHQLKMDILDCDSVIKREGGDLEANGKAQERLKKEIEEYQNKITEVENEENPVKSQIKDKTAKIKEQEKELVEKDEEFTKEKEELEDLIEWESNFKRFKSFLANQSLGLIEQQSNHYLDKMKCDNRISIDGFRELANGKLKEEISIEVSRDGLTTESFGKFSGGEKAKVDLSCILAMQSLINTSCVHGGLNLLFCDEILESADEVAMNSIANSLKNVDKTVFIIAQSQPNADCNTLEVQKKDKISKIINHG